MNPDKELKKLSVVWQHLTYARLISPLIMPINTPTNIDFTYFLTQRNQGAVIGFSLFKNAWTYDSNRQDHNTSTCFQLVLDSMVILADKLMICCSLQWHHQWQHCKCRISGLAISFKISSYCNTIRIKSQELSRLIWQFPQMN